MAKKRKVHSLTGRITPKLMSEAWKAVKRNRGAAGIDKVSVQMFQENLDANLTALMHDLKKGTFQPKPLRRVWIPKDAKGKKLRPLGIPTIYENCTQAQRRFGIGDDHAPISSTTRTAVRHPQDETRR